MYVLRKVLLGLAMFFCGAVVLVGALLIIAALLDRGSDSSILLAIGVAMAALFGWVFSKALAAFRTDLVDPKKIQKELEALSEKAKAEQEQVLREAEEKRAEIIASAQKEADAIKAHGDEIKEGLKDQEAFYLKLKKEAEQDALKSTEADRDILKDQIGHLKQQLADEQEKLKALHDQIKEAQAKIIETDENVLLQSFGFFVPHYLYDTSETYKAAIVDIRNQEKELVKSDQAVAGATDWEVNGSKAQGKKMVSDMKKLLLRAFNAECDDAIEHVKFNNYESCQKKITASFEAVAKLGTIMRVFITPEYHELKMKELRLMYESKLKKQEEKDALKESRARMREEAKLAKELEEARKKLEKEQTHYSNALDRIKIQLETASEEDRGAIEAKKAELEAQLEKIDKEFKDVDYRAANQRAGYVYVISNIGAFGENVYKIGMTRRLDPMDRVDELGDASVPFNFDVHAMIFSDDAPKLEAALHQAFADRKVNFINTRREFFRVSLDEIKKVVRENFDKSVDFIDVAPAEQYRESLAIQSGTIKNQTETVV